MIPVAVLGLGAGALPAFVRLAAEVAVMEGLADVGAEGLR